MTTMQQYRHARTGQGHGAEVPRSTTGEKPRRWLGLVTLLLGLAALAPGARADGDLVWATAMGGAGGDEGRGIAVDAAGNVYTTGNFQGTADFGPFSLTSEGFNDTFVAKQAPDGTFLWVRRIGGTSDIRGWGIAVDAAGNVYTTGEFFGTADFDPGLGVFNLTSAGLVDIFVSKLDANGDFVWAHATGGSAGDSGFGIAVDGAGNVYTTGSFVGTVDFDPGPGTFNLISAGDADIFVSKLDTNGDFVWARAMGGTGMHEGQAIAVDAAGNVFTTGYFQDTVDFDPGLGVFNLTSAGLVDIFVSKLDANGDFVWAHAMVGTGWNVGYGIAVDSAGNAYVTGTFDGQADFGPFQLDAGGSSNIHVAKLDPSGNFLWARAMGGTGFNQGLAIAVDAADDVYTTGRFTGTADFDPGPDTYNLTTTGGVEIFVSKLDTNGDFVWARAMSGTGFNNRGQGIAADGAGNVHTTGNFVDTRDFDPGTGTFNLTSAGDSDIFVLKLSGPDLTPPNAITITPGTTGPTNADSIDFSVAFDEEVVNFDDASDLDISHSGTAHTGVSITGGPEVYTVTVEGISGDGSFTLAVDTMSDVQDLAGNPLDSSVTSDPVVIDNTAPVFSGLDVTPSEASVGQEVVVTFASSEDLAGPPDVLVNGNPASASLKSPFAFAYTVSPLDPLGPATIQINGVDLAGNAGQLNDSLSLVVVEGAPGLPAAWPMLAALVLFSVGAFTLHGRRRTTSPQE